MFELTDIIQTVLAAVSGSGLTLLTIRATKKKANADADMSAALARSQEIRNVADIAAQWRENSERLDAELEKVQRKFEESMRETEKLRAKFSRVLDVLQRINTENEKDILQKINTIINENI